MGLWWVNIGRIALYALRAPFLLLYVCHRRMLDREELTTLGDDTLDDIGLTREQVSRKLGRGLWHRQSSSRDRTPFIWFDRW